MSGAGTDDFFEVLAVSVVCHRLSVARCALLGPQALTVGSGEEVEQPGLAVRRQGITPDRQAQSRMRLEPLAVIDRRTQVDGVQSHECIDLVALGTVGDVQVVAGGREDEPHEGIDLVGGEV